MSKIIAKGILLSKTIWCARKHNRDGAQKASAAFVFFIFSILITGIISCGDFKDQGGSATEEKPPVSNHSSNNGTGSPISSNGENPQVKNPSPTPLLTPSPQLTPNPIATPSPEEPLVAEFDLVETEEPHSYQINLSWNPGAEKVVIEFNDTPVFETNSFTKYVIPIKDNTKYKVKVFEVKGSEFKTAGSFEGVTPKDLTVDQDQSLTTDTEWSAHRIFISDGIKIITNGNIFRINADFLNFENGNILTFTQGAKATNSKQGRSGNLIHIHAKKAQGAVTVNMRGEAGSDGIDGPAFTERAIDGPQGSPGEVSTGYGSSGPSCFCLKTPGPGGNGASGAKGKPGTNGFSGGNSGRLIVEVDEQSDFIVKPFQEFGVGGNGGRGGPGQEGGNGGKSGPIKGYCDSHLGTRCISAQNGNKGTTGPRGDDATSGANGVLEPICISIGQGVGKCKP